AQCLNVVSELWPHVAAPVFPPLAAGLKLLVESLRHIQFVRLVFAEPFRIVEMNGKVMAASLGYPNGGMEVPVIVQLKGLLKVNGQALITAPGGVNAFTMASDVGRDFTKGKPGRNLHGEFDVAPNSFDNT